MHRNNEMHTLARRQFFTSTASGLGAAALMSLLAGESQGASVDRSLNPLAPLPPHFTSKAKQCIFFLPEGAPSQIDLFDQKPKLNELHGQKVPDSLVKNVRFA